MPALDNPRHERFAQSLADGKTATDAYLDVSGKKDRQYASELRHRPDISKRVAELQARRAAMADKATEKATDRLALTKEWVIGRLMENAERALQRVPVLNDDGKPTGEWRYDGSVANRALELLGKHLGILIERREIGEPGEFDRLADAELLADLRERAERLGLPLPGGGETAH